LRGPGQNDDEILGREDPGPFSFFAISEMELGFLGICCLPRLNRESSPFPRPEIAKRVPGYLPFSSGDESKHPINPHSETPHMEV